MSWHYSRVLVAAYSEATCSDGERSAPSSTTATPEAYSSHDRTTARSTRSRSGMMSAPLTDTRGEALLTSFREDSRARTFQRQERAPELLDPDPDSGPKWRALSVRFDPVSCGWKTARCLSEEDLDWSSLTLPKWGSLHDGELWARDTPALLTEGTESGSWPTPTACTRPNESTQRMFRAKWLSGEMSLEEANAMNGKDVRLSHCKVAIWPTPMAQDAKHSGYAPSGPGKTDKLAYAVVRANWPTPTASDANQRRKTENWRGNDLGSQVTSKEEENGRQMPQAGGKLNPNWVEWLMGWPIGWTDCVASATDRYRQWSESHGTHSSTNDAKHQRKEDRTNGND